MAIIQGSVIKGSQGAAYPGSSGDVVVNRYAISLPVAGTLVPQIQNNDIIEIGTIPPNCTVIDAVLIADAQAGSAGVIGIMTGNVGAALNPDNSARTCGAELFATLAGIASGGVTRPTANTAFKIAPTGAERSIGIQFTTKPTTQAAGSIILQVQLATA
jgi:hypothetical protein